MHIFIYITYSRSFFSPLTEKKINSYGSEKSFFFPIRKLKFLIFISKSGNVKFQDFCQFLVIF